MAAPIKSKRQLCATDEMAAHVMDIISAIHESSSENRHMKLTATCGQPAALPVGR